MILMLGFIMVVSSVFLIYYGAASFAYLDLCYKHETYFAKYRKKRYKKYARYYKICYKRCLKLMLISMAVCIISIIVGYLTL